MDFSESTFFKIFGVVVALGGFYGIVQGKLTAGFEGTDRFNRTVKGVTAKFLSLAYVATGCSFFFVNPTAAIFATLSVFAMTWALGSPAE